jgi:hypothetical protein
MNKIELIGYLGSLLVGLSLLMSNVYRLRIFNAIGAFIFIIYSLIIHANAVFAVNSFILLVDLYYIHKLRNGREIFKFIEVNQNDKLLEYFLNYNLRDILYFFPRYSGEDIKSSNVFLIMRNLIVVGIFAFKREENKIKIILDYVIKDYRDLKNAKSFFNSSQIREKFHDAIEIYTITDNSEHIKYLKQLGFEKKADEDFYYYKEINPS